MALDYRRDYRKMQRRRRIVTIVIIVCVFLAASFVVLFLRAKDNFTPDRLSDVGKDFFAEQGTGSGLMAKQITRNPVYLYSIAIPPTLPEDTTVEYVADDPSEPVPDSYFDDALFIGDSRTEGFMLYTSLSNIHAYASKGLSISRIYEDAIVDMGDGRVLTVMDALREQQFGKIYIMFGVNELGWPVDELFYDQYSRMVEDIKALQPDAIIYVQNIIPISAERSAKDSIYNNDNVNRFNAVIAQVCEDRNVILLNVHDALADENGCLPADASTDGVHCNAEYCDKWLQYLRENTYHEE